MKMKRHLVAAALAVGLAGSAMGLTKTDDNVEAQAGYMLASYAFNDSPFHEAAAAAGALWGLGPGRRFGISLGARLGATAGGFFGPIGMIVGAGVGAL